MQQTLGLSADSYINMLRFYRTIHHSQLGHLCKRLPGTLCRRQLSSLVPPNENADGKKDDDTLTLLYQRDDERNALPKTSFLVSSLNSMYWVWYVADFVPAVNASPVENFHIDPIYGYGGLGLSILIQTAFTLYPLSLVSKIALSPTISNSDSGDGKKASATPQEILVWKHTLPLLRTSSKPLVFPVGSISLDRTSENTRVILEDLGGNIGNFEGFLGLKKVKETKQSSLASYFPLLVDIRKPSEVCDSESMIQVLLSGGNNRHNHKGTKKQRSAEDPDKKFYPKKYQKKKRHRGKKY